MTFPSGGPGYPQQGGGQQPPGPPPSGGFPQQQPPPHSHQAHSSGSALPQNLPFLLTLAVAGLGLVQYFLGFAGDAGSLAGSTQFALVAAGLAGIHLLPKGPKTLPFVGLFALLSGLEAVDAVIGAPVMTGIAIVVLILSLLQLAAGVGAVLIEFDVLKPPAPKPAAPQGGGQYGGPPQQFGQHGGQQQPYGGPPQFGQPPQGPVAATGEPSPGYQPQAPYTGPTPPSTTPPPQATTYAPMQGQFFQQPPSDQPPGTPPGGFGQSS